MGEKATTGCRGKVCLETLEKDAMDVVILDTKMPGMDGIETLKRRDRK